MIMTGPRHLTENGAKLMSGKWEQYILYGGDMPMLDLPEVKMPDSVLIVDSKTGCMFVGDHLIHSESCMCGEEI